MTKQEFKSATKIYKSHTLASGMISVTYANVLGASSVSTEKTIVVEKMGGALESLYNHFFC